MRLLLFPDYDAGVDLLRLPADVPSSMPGAMPVGFQKPW
jgi:hypothetical protein